MSTLLRLDPPEIYMDQQWTIIDKMITVKVDCIVHGNPSSQVNLENLI